jgi:hypothetical protein
MEKVLEKDDPSIDNEKVLWRRVPKDWIVFDNSLNRYRPTSQVFQNTSGTDGMSVNMADETTIEATLKGCEKMLLAQFEAALARELGQGIIRMPLETNLAHCEVIGEKTKSVRERFAKDCQWVIGPETEP